MTTRSTSLLTVAFLLAMPALLIATVVQPLAAPRHSRPRRSTRPGCANTCAP